MNTDLDCVKRAVTVSISCNFGRIVAIIERMDTADLWQQILAAPGDENLKTQYVEALAEAGDWRAEMFHLAAEIDRLTRGSYLGPAAELKPRYERLLAEWRVGFETPAQTWPAEVKFIQGWPIEITMKASDFARHAAQIVTTLPLRHLNLTVVSEAPEVFTVAQFGQIASLDGSHQRWLGEAIMALADSPQLRSLRWLDLSDTQITDAEVEILAASALLRDVQHVDVGDNPCQDPVDASAGYGTDWQTGGIIWESVYLPEFGKQLEERYGRIGWLRALEHFGQHHPPSRYLF